MHAVHTESQTRILVVDDDQELRDHVASYLAGHGYSVLVARDAFSMEAMLAGNEVDLVILDVMMPGEDGLSVCRRLAQGPGPAVIMLSAMGDDTDRILGLELGADDYLAKPCNPRELLARVRAVLRRREDAAPGDSLRTGTLSFLGFTVSPTRRRVKAPNGVSILFTAGEFALLCAFLSKPEVILSRERLLELARGGDASTSDRVVDVQVSRLRRKLHACSETEIIRTFRGSGYMFDAKVTRA
ncbi:MAG TPA: response regulator [Caulobacteraceae bacterium]|jgi:two-component system OmpR family response regulator